ncbi:heterokaryon incompatibility protein [Ilyonectria robusta]
MPKTIQDAVTICRQLGVKFLWIDALCIIQGDDSEWNRESPKIAGIFANAILTIAADSADGVEKGFLDHLTPASCTDDDVNGGIHQCPSPLSWNEPLNRRAWSLAEVIFSNRIVHYTSLEMVWECNETRTWECGHSLAVENDDEDSFRIFRNLSLPNPPTRDDLYCKWTIVIRQFTRRQINSHGRQDRDSARLTALARVARRFSEIMKKLSDVEDEYLAGIWKGDLSRSLLWSVDTDFCSGELGQHQQWRRPQQPRAPSWSWAAVEGPATVQRVSDFQTEVHFETVIVRPANPDDPFGAVTSGELVVRGRVVHNLHVKLQNHDPANNIDAQIWHVHVNIHGESSKFLADVPLDGVKQFHTLSCVYFGNGQIGGSSTEEQQPYHAFLLLQPISGAESTFQRVGISTPSTSCAGISILFDHATEERITIV